VGAGLPIISTLRSLLDSGDQIKRIEACMSGTLGYLCTALEEGLPLSNAVRIARDNGWTEPDPRDDLSGIDVARKALILARTWGLPWDMGHVPGTPWFPPDLAEVSIDAFMDLIEKVDQEYAERVSRAQARQHVLRYVAAVEADGASIELRELPLDHPLAALRGSDNLFVFTTMRYADQPLTVRGPGAGVEVTAAGVLADIVATAREL
jgi:homoserine dehydrogenase